MLYNVTFKSIAECQKLNTLTEAQIVEDLRTYYENKNYRTNYNREKNAALQTPEAKAFLKKVRDARKK